jgi:hypothetical protein
VGVSANFTEGCFLVDKPSLDLSDELDDRLGFIGMTLV